MYRQKDYEDICAQLRTRRVAVYVAAGALMALSVVSFAMRWPQAATAALSAAAVCLFVFCYCMLIAPVKAYRKHIDHALHGHTHDTQGEFVAMEDEAVVRDGLRLIPFQINVGAGIRDDGNRLFYYDANLPRPDWQSGETLLITSYDNRAIGWTRVKIKA